jgi:hypothetical protein
MNTTEFEPKSSPAHLVAALGKKPLNKAELMSYLANLHVYAEYHYQEAKESNYDAGHPYHSADGKAAFYAEISAIQAVFVELVEDLKAGKIRLEGKDMRLIGDIVGNSQFSLEKALATYQLPFRGQVKPADLPVEGVSHAR